MILIKLILTFTIVVLGIALSSFIDFPPIPYTSFSEAAPALIAFTILFLLTVIGFLIKGKSIQSFVISILLVMVSAPYIINPIYQVIFAAHHKVIGAINIQDANSLHCKDSRPNKMVPYAAAGNNKFIILCPYSVNPLSWGYSTDEVTFKY